MARYDGKVALVTGGTAGIGAATVERLVQEGAQVVFTGRNVDAGQAMAHGTGATFVRHAVEDHDAWGGVETAVRALGRLDLAFANAGIEGGDTDIEEIGIAAWNEILAVNLTGPMLTAQAAIRVMRDNPEGPTGAIVVNSSISGLLGLPGNVGYTTTKGGVRLLVKSVAMHCATRGYRIRCNAILPGVVATALIEGAIAGAPDPGAARATLEGISPMKRMARLEEIAGLVAYLGSDDAAFITGADYVIDGGATAGWRVSDLPEGAPIRQIAYFVSDIRTAARDHRATFGSGPFLVIDHVPTPVVRYRGAQAALDHGSAYGQWGELMVEFVQQHDAGPSAFHDMYPRGSGRFGLHHVAIWVDRLPGAIARFEEAGHACALYAETDHMAFAMIDMTATLGHMIELYEPTPILTDFYGRIRAMANDRGPAIVPFE